VRNKLYELGCSSAEVERHIADLIEKDMLNEERYARAIARGRFHLKKWGRIKIRQHLKQNKVSDYCIKKALTEIDGDTYLLVLKKLADQKWTSLKTEKNMFARRSKVSRYLLQKGYETDLINDVLQEIIVIAG
jgi:regulatory protein